MWPLERQRPVIRLGPRSAQVWVRDGLRSAGLEMTNEVSMGAGLKPAAVQAALRDAFGIVKARGERSAHLVVESALLPVMLVVTGRLALRRHQLETLARHRFSELFDDRGRSSAAARGLLGTTAGWSVQVSHRPGDELALTCGLPAALRLLVDEAVNASGAGIASLEPAILWGWRALARARRSAGMSATQPTWWVWSEQDRALIGCWRHDLLQALNAGAEPPLGARACVSAVEVEAIRSGLDVPSRAVLAGWEPAPFAPTPGRLAVLSVGATKAAANAVPAKVAVA